MDSLAESQRERALFMAARDYEFARLVGDGDIVEGLLRLRVAERRAARRVPIHTPAPAAAENQTGVALPITAPLVSAVSSTKVKLSR